MTNSTTRTPIRIGLIGFGYIGSYLHDQITQHPEWGLQMAFVSSGRNRGTNAAPELELDNLCDFAERRADLIVEAAHPSVTVEHGERFLRETDYMPLSLTALADAALERTLRQTAKQAGTCLYIPHGAAVGLDSLAECHDLWESVTITMRKNPRNLDFTEAQGLDPESIRSETILYDGPTRDVCRLFPRNVNSHAATALAGIGFDRTRSVLVADPSLDVSIIELKAEGSGLHLHVQRSNPLKGVSGVMTLRSILACVQRIKARGIPFQVC